MDQGIAVSPTAMGIYLAPPHTSPVNHVMVPVQLMALSEYLKQYTNKGLYHVQSHNNSVWRKRISRKTSCSQIPELRISHDLYCLSYRIQK
jgi:hypothetical protein